MVFSKKQKMIGIVLMGRHDAPDRAEAADRVYRTVARRDSKAAPASERKGVTVLSGCSGQGNAAVWDGELSE